MKESNVLFYRKGFKKNTSAAKICFRIIWSSIVRKIDNLYSSYM